MPIANNLKEHLKWISLDGPQFPIKDTIGILRRASTVPSPFDTLVAIASPSLSYNQLPSNLTTRTAPLQQSTQINRPTLSTKTNASEDEVIDITNDFEFSKPKRRNIDDILTKRQKTNNEDPTLHSTSPSTNYSTKRIPLQANNSIDSPPSIDLLRKYILLCEAKINLLQSQLPQNSQLTKLSCHQNLLKQKLPFLQSFNLTQFIESLPDLHIPQPASELPPLQYASSISRQPYKQIPETIPYGNSPSVDTINAINEIDFDSDFSDTHIDEETNFNSVARENKRKQAETPVNQHQVVTTPIMDDEEEDNFGDGLMDGLTTPSQDREGDYDDLSDFINDHSMDESIDHTYNDAATPDSNNSIDEVDANVLEEIKLSQDVAEKYGIDYTNASRSSNRPMTSEIDLTSDTESNKAYGDDIEEIDDIDFTTQLNQEREITTTDIIEISSDDDDDLGPSVSSKSAHVVNDHDTYASNFAVNEHNDSDFSDDEELMQLINTKQQELQQQRQPQVPDHTQVPTQIPPGSEPFIRDVYHVLRTVFKLPEFRPHQLEAVISTLLGNDVFVLMPTGGGKSLCYQLPALIKSGLTLGTTIVISPLISLMQDQVQHLLDKNIKAGMISSKSNGSERSETFNLFKEGLLDLVYLSPEMVSASNRVKNIIEKLANSNQLSRFVIDEAHCVSSWGHDFRPDYKVLSMFKVNYPRIPIMALTATANEKVRMDILHHLKMNNPTLLKQSFNRTNLYYEVKRKEAKFVESIRDYILERFNGKSGIIYCHSKASCHQTSEKLLSWGIKSSPYHASMEPEDRLKIQQLWQKNKLQVICATIAFGMGIDKPDVRFVIHIYIPRTLEGYYQETGRAGRDGNNSECIMYYNYRDARTLQNLIQNDREISNETRESHLMKLRQVIQYCENDIDCRRQQVLQYFNEKFNPKDCNKKCDNCINSKNIKSIEKDFTESAKDIILLIKSIQNDRVTLLHCQDVFKGSRNSKIVRLNHHLNDYHGRGQNLNRTEIERVFFHLLTENYLMEYQIMNGSFATNYLKLGNNYNAIINNQVRIRLTISETIKSRNLSSVASETGRSRNAYSASTSSRSVSLHESTVAGPSNLSNYRFDQTFRSAREIQLEQNQYEAPSKIELRAPVISNQGNVEYNFKELNNIRIQKSFELGFPVVQSFISDDTLRDMAIKLPTNKRDFGKLNGIDKSKVEFFVNFKKILMTLSKQRKKGEGSQTTSPYFNGSQRPSQKKSYKVSKFKRGNHTRGSQRGSQTRSNGQTRGSQSRSRGSQANRRAAPMGMPL